MGSANFLKELKKHQKYFYISIFLIVIFFAGSAIINPKITSVAKDLLETGVLENLKSKKNSISFELTQLNSFLDYSENLIDESSNSSFQELQGKLFFTGNLARSSDLISNSFIYLKTPLGIEEITAPYKERKIGVADKISMKIDDLPTSSKFVDTILKTEEKVINRKMYIHERSKDSTIVFGYDIDLLAFWKYYSENNEARIAYTVVTNKEGICLLHPEQKYIGKKLDSYFSEVPLKTILKNNSDPHGYVLKDEATSEYLNLEVRRYFDKIKVGTSSVIIIENIPIDLILNQVTPKIDRYFLWISLLAFIVFILLLLVSRYQLKKEFLENIKMVEEKEQLINANEKYQKENAVLQLNQLKKKMNPHFLFNSLNSLHILIESKPELSQEFVLKLANVYRYLLENKEGNLITVKKEITFLEQYFFLHEIRFKNSLNVSINNSFKDEKILYKKIPFLALETLVENAIKHNEFTKHHPLNIEINNYAQHIEVINNYAPRKIEKGDSHKIGLKYLKNTYDYYNVRGFKTEISDGKFKCFLPLLS